VRSLPDRAGHGRDQHDDVSAYREPSDSSIPELLREIVARLDRIEAALLTAATGRA